MLQPSAACAENCGRAVFNLVKESKKAIFESVISLLSCVWFHDSAFNVFGFLSSAGGNCVPPGVIEKGQA
jgi:hypothetical protein